MRAAVAIAGVFVAMLLQAGSAVAHGAMQGAAIEATSSTAALVTAPAEYCFDNPAPSAVVVASPASDRPAARGHDHDLTNHNRDDHSHPFGADLFHQMVAHQSLDFAAWTQPDVRSTFTTVRLALPVVENGLSGMNIQPPVPPPLV